MRCRRHRQRQRMVRPSPWSGCVVASVRPSAPWRCASTAPVSAAVARAQSAPATVIEGGARQPLPHVLAQERQQRRRQVGTLRQHCHARADPSGLSSISRRSASSGSGAHALQSCSACAKWSARSDATAADASVSMSPGMVRWSASDMKRLSRRTSCSPAVSNASSVVAGSDSCNACARR
jgi:hypothetical protein